MLDDYKDSMNYEAFMRRAYKSNRQLDKGVDAVVMQNLILAEQESTSVQHLPNREDQLAQVKQYILNAFDLFLERDLTKEERARLNEMRGLVNLGYNSAHLNEIVKSGLDITMRFKDF